MSFDISLDPGPACPTCGHAPDAHLDCNVTHNINPMVELVFAGVGSDLRGTSADTAYQSRSWGRLHGHLCSDVRPLLGEMLEWFTEHESELVHLNPNNGWGSTKCVRRVLLALIEAADESPGCRIGTWG